MTAGTPSWNVGPGAGPVRDPGGGRARGPRVGAVDGLLIGVLAAFTALGVVFHSRVDGWLGLAAANLGAATVVLAAMVLARRIRNGVGRAAVRTIVVSLAVAYLFGAVDRLQLIFHEHWLDESVLSFEQAVFGVQPTLWLERFTRPWLTETMMFTYVVYIVLYPVVCGVIYWRAGEDALERCLFTLALVNVLCDAGFIVFPIAGPSAFIGGQFTIPLKGYVFAAAGEFIRSRLHYVGGSLPSPHCAAATVLWVMAWRHHRRFAWAIAPIIAILYVATFYCRYHYVSDAVAGILTALVALAIAPALLRCWGPKPLPE